MIAANLFLAVLVLGAGVLGLGVFFIAVFKGAFDDPASQAGGIFDERDLRYLREWETADQQAERRVAHGESVRAAPGEWGGAR